MPKLNIKMGRLNKDDCNTCKTMAEENGMTQKKLDADHSDCHGWFHCGSDCCGSCFICGK